MAGAFTGAVLALHSRRAPVIALSAGLSAVMMVGVDGASQLVQSITHEMQARREQ